MNVLVTGGAGFIGAHTVAELLRRGHEVTVLDNWSSGRNQPDCELIMADVREIGFFLRDRRFDGVIHLAAQPSLLRSLEDPAHDADVNIVGTLKVAQFAKACGARLVMASTSAVYDPCHSPPCYEKAPTKPNRPYGLAKLTAERYLPLILGEGYCVLRYGNVYGELQVPVGENQLVPRALRHVLRGDAFEVYGDGRQTRDFVYVGDIARANVMALEDGWSGVFNAGRGVGETVNAVLAHLTDLLKWHGNWRYGAPKAGEPRDVWLGTGALRARDWIPQMTLQEGLERTVRWALKTF